jgi:hypothetical protein
MRWLAPAVVVFFVLAFGGFFLLARGFQTRANQQYGYNGYGSPTGASDPRVVQAQTEGKTGWPKLKALMLDKDDNVAFQAALALTSSAQPSALDAFFEQLPATTTFVREGCRGAWFEPKVFERAAVSVKDRDPKTMKGAMLLLKLSYMRDGYGMQHHAFETLVSAIPDYKGAEADELAYTISLFTSADPQPLVDMLKHADPEARTTALKALGKMNRFETKASVQALKTDPDPEVQKAAVQAEKSITATAPVAYTPQPGRAAPPVQGDAGRLGMPK